MDSGENLLNSPKESFWHRGYILAILIVAIVTVKLPRLLPLGFGLEEWLYPALSSCGLMAIIPFLFAWTIRMMEEKK